MAKWIESNGFGIDTEINKWGELELWKYTLSFPSSIETGSFKSEEDAHRNAVKYAIEILSSILKDLDPNTHSEIIDTLMRGWAISHFPDEEEQLQRDKMLTYLGVSNESH